jgi:hypothetical protein
MAKRGAFAQGTGHEGTRLQSHRCLRLFADAFGGRRLSLDQVARNEKERLTHLSDSRFLFLRARQTDTSPVHAFTSNPDSIAVIHSNIVQAHPRTRLKVFRCTYRGQECPLRCASHEKSSNVFIRITSGEFSQRFPQPVGYAIGPKIELGGFSAEKARRWFYALWTADLIPTSSS